MQTASQPVHTGPKNATQSLEFFRAHGIKGVPVAGGPRRGARVLREYVCLTEHLGGTVAPFAHRILALPQQHA